MSTRDLIAYHRRLAEALEEWDRLVTEARRLGQPIPIHPGAQREPKTPISRQRRAGKRARSKFRIQARDVRVVQVGSNGTAPEVTVNVSDLTRPQLCLAILRQAGRPMGTGEIIAAARRLGHDWSNVAGGPDNAVHGALWRERQNRRVRKAEDGPWELLADSIAPRLSPDNKMATMRASRSHQAGLRRDRILALFQGKTWAPDALLAQMRSYPDFKTMTRASMRDDLGNLIAEGKVEKVGFGEYREVR